MDITVVICTYNRAATLHIPLDSMVKQHYPTEHFEVIVVDNNSTDATRHIVESYQERLPNLRYIFEPQQGLSIARNKGWQDAAAPIVAYLDDDAGACEKWLGEIVKVFEEETPRPACVGGPVQLDWGGKKPDWLPESYLQMYTQLDLGDERINLRINEHILQGANMAFDRQILLQESGFDEALGRSGNKLISGEETALIRKLLFKGYGIVYTPEASVVHLVLPERRSRRYFWKRLIYDGKSQVLVDLNEGRINRAGIGRRALYELKMGMVQLLAAIGSTGRKEFTTRKIEFLKRVGRVSMILELVLTGEI